MSEFELCAQELYGQFVAACAYRHLELSGGCMQATAAAQDERILPVAAFCRLEPQFLSSHYHIAAPYRAMSRARVTAFTSISPLSFAFHSRETEKTHILRTPSFL